MKINRIQDNKASIPMWYRRFIEYLGSNIIETLDKLGKSHDGDILKYGYILSSFLLTFRIFIIPTYYIILCLICLCLISLPVSIGVFLYSIVPKGVKLLYWKCISYITD